MHHVMYNNSHNTYSSEAVLCPLTPSSGSPVQLYIPFNSSMMQAIGNRSLYKIVTLLKHRHTTLNIIEVPSVMCIFRVVCLCFRGATVL